MDFSILLGHNYILGMPLKLLGELSCCHHHLAYYGHNQTQVEFIALELVPNIFDYLPIGSTAVICPPGPINLYCPQRTTRL